jgi:hypothetical protein
MIGTEIKMHKITYKNLLKRGKNKNDFQKWLNQYWSAQKTWGAKDVKFWTQKDGNYELLYSQYYVERLDQWIQAAQDAHASPIIQELEQICECNKITIEPVNT